MELELCLGQLTAFNRHICANDKKTSFYISEFNHDLDENGYMVLLTELINEAVKLFRKVKIYD